jgi:WD40 repeat protein
MPKKMGSLGAKVLHDRNPNIEKVTEEPDPIILHAAVNATGKTSGGRLGFKVALQFEAFIRRNLKLVQGQPGSVFQLALNEPDVSMIARYARRQLTSTNIPSLRLTRKSQHLEPVVFDQEEEEEVCDIDFIPADPLRGLGPRVVSGVGPKVRVWNVNREHVEMDLGCLPDEDWEDVSKLKASKDGLWAVACYNDQGRTSTVISVWDLRLGERAQHIGYESGGITCLAVATEPPKHMSQEGIVPDNGNPQPDNGEGGDELTAATEEKKKRDGKRIDDSESDFTDEEGEEGNSYVGGGAKEGWGTIDRVENEKVAAASRAAEVENFIHDNGGMIFATGSTDGAAVVWNRRGEVVSTCKAHPGFGHVTSLCLSLDGKTMIVGYLEGCIQSFGVVENSTRREFHGTHDKEVSALAISLRSTEALSGSYRQISKWSVQFGSREKSITAHASFVRAIAYGAECFVSGGDDKMVKVWTKRDLALLRVYSQHTASITSLAIEFDRRNSIQLVSGLEVQ